MKEELKSGDRVYASNSLVLMDRWISGTYVGANVVAGMILYVISVETPISENSFSYDLVSKAYVMSEQYYDEIKKDIRKSTEEIMNEKDILGIPNRRD